jgi:hypothetical protein
LVCAVVVFIDVVVPPTPFPEPPEPVRPADFDPDDELLLVVVVPLVVVPPVIAGPLVTPVVTPSIEAPLLKLPAVPPPPVPPPPPPAVAPVVELSSGAPSVGDTVVVFVSVAPLVTTAEVGAVALVVDCTRLGSVTAPVPTWPLPSVPGVLPPTVCADAGNAAASDSIATKARVFIPRQRRAGVSVPDHWLQRLAFATVAPTTIEDGRSECPRR